jgi:hypothetical protein
LKGCSTATYTGINVGALRWNVGPSWSIGDREQQCGMYTVENLAGSIEAAGVVADLGGIPTIM